MKRALVASLVLHGVFGAALLSFELHDGDGSRIESNAIAIEVVAPPMIAPPRDVPPSDVQGGGSFMTRASDAQARAREAAVRTMVASRGERRGRANARAIELARAQLGDYAIDRGELDRGCGGACGGGVERDGDGGEGTGVGGNRGSGIGFGDGGKIVLAEEAFALPPPPKPASKARPAKLIYPTRERDLGEERLFVARVTVDADGYVVGAKLVRGHDGPRDDEAADLIFRFRYLPALDDDGRAIRSTFEQPFHVNR